MFAIGQALQGHVNDGAETIFNDAYDLDSRFGPAEQAIAFYEAQIKATKDAMHAWTQVGIKSWHQVESCEGREKVDCKVDLGFKRASIVRRDVLTR
jgi:hypothetical protein